MAAYGSLIYFVALIAIFYLLIIRPQSMRAKEHKTLVDSVVAGDDIVTAGGIYGKVTEVHDSTVKLNVAPDVDILISKQSIAMKQ